MNTTDWESSYAQGIAPWDRGSVSPPLRSWFQAHGIPSGRVLVPGCGHGHEVAFLHQLGAEVYGLDIAPTGLQGAGRLHPEVPLDRWLLADLFALPAELKGSFTMVVEHTCLSGMPPELRTAYADAVLDALQPGGLIIGVWFIQPDLDPGESGPPFPLPVHELDAMFTGRAEILEDEVPANSFPGREGRERLRILRKL
jgi:methyl halide transferase